MTLLPQSFLKVKVELSQWRYNKDTKVLTGEVKQTLSDIYVLGENRIFLNIKHTVFFNDGDKPYTLAKTQLGKYILLMEYERARD